MKKVIFIISIFGACAIAIGGWIIYSVNQPSWYNDFDVYQRDFENILSVIKTNGKGRYWIDDQKRKLYYKSTNGQEYIEVSLSKTEQESLYNIVEHSKRSSNKRISNISSNDYHIMFYEETAGWGIMYTEDIKSSIEVYNGGKNRFSYKHLNGNWYEIDD